MIRADSSGYSMIVDKSGRILAEARLGTREVIDAEFPAVARCTFYKRFGDWFLWLCGIVVAVSAINTLRNRKPRATSTASPAEG